MKADERYRQHDGSGVFVQALRMGESYQISLEHQFGLPVAVKSHWEGNRLVVYYNGLSRINFYKLRFVFQADSVDLDVRDLTNKQQAAIKGMAVK